MSDTVSTRTKTVSDSISSDTSGHPIFNDRWSNNISYRQLVVSSCIGIVQLWWHPYIYDLQKLLPFLFLYNIFSILVGYPMFYLELAVGVVTKKGVIGCWDMAPMARGVGMAMLATCTFTAIALSIIAAWCLAFFVHSCHSFLPWLHCAATATPPCAARHRSLPPSAETPAQSFFFNFVLHYKRDGIDNGLGPIVWEAAVYYTICWFLIYGIIIKKIYSYSKMVLFKDVMTYFVLICCGIGVTRLEGAGTMFYACDWSILFNDVQMWCEAVEYALIEMTVGQGSLVMLGTYCPKQQHPLGRTSLVAFAASKTSSMVAAMTLGAAHGALKMDYNNATTIMKGPSASLVLWSDYVARIPGSQFWSAILFFTFFVLALTSTALLVQTIISSFTGRSVRKITWIFLILLILLFSLIGIITLCTEGGLHVLSFLLDWPALKPRVAIALILTLVITYIYGQTMFCEDVYFAVGEYPCVFFRVCWALVPAMLTPVFLIGMSAGWPGSEAFAGWLLVMFCIIPITIIALLYLCFKVRVRNIVGTEK